MQGPPITSKVVAHIVFGLGLTGFYLLLSYIISSEATEITDIPEGLEEYIFIQRFLNNPECFAYQDKDTSRVYPGIVDLNKFKPEILDYCYKPSNGMGFKLSIGEMTIETSNFEFSTKTISKHILIFKDNRFENAEIEIES